MTKFISQLNPANPEDKDALRKHMFGQDYVLDKSTGEPVEKGLGSEWSLANGKSDHALQGHITGIARDEGLEAAHAAIAKIQAQRRANGLPEFKFENSMIERAARAGEAARAG